MKTILVTGASSGIGRATAIQLSNDGYELLLLGRDREKLESTQQLLDGPSQILPCDLSDKDQTQQTVKLILQNDKLFKGQFYGLVNNAGIFLPNSFNESTDEEWEKIFMTNLQAPNQLCRGLFPLLKENSPGVVVHVSSSAALRPVPGTSAYSALKAALNMTSQIQALEWAPFNIRVNTVCPGIVDTPIHEFHGKEPGELEAVQKLQPLGRIGKPEEVASAISYLVSDKCQWMTGSDLTIDGGIHLV